jgi:hypothetical protein
MPRLQMYFLGPPRVELDGEPVSISRHKALALLAYLAVTGRRHRRDALATLFSPEHDQSRARAELRRALAALRAALGEGWADGGHPLDTDRESVALNPEADFWVDVQAFQEELAQVRAHGHARGETCPECLNALTEAADLYQDDFLAGFTLKDSPAFDDWQFFETQGLRDEMAWALERLARIHAESGEYEQAVGYARPRCANMPNASACWRRNWACRRTKRPWRSMREFAQARSKRQRSSQLKARRKRRGLFESRRSWTRRLWRWIPQRRSLWRGSGSWRGWMDSFERRWPVRARWSLSPAVPAAARRR